MKYLEHRRHSIRKVPLPHLNQKGVSLARNVGQSLNNIFYVITSPVTRAFETAIAMGFAVNETLEELATLEAVEREVSWNAGFGVFSQVYQQNGNLKEFADSLKEQFLNYLKKIPNSSTLLAISHGGIVEASAIGCLPDYDFSEHQYSVSYCEGVRLHFDGSNFTAIEFLNLS